jgi:predicted metal-binding membrane protein
MAITASALTARAGGRHALLFALLASLALASWAALLAWSASPYARYLAHDGWGEDGALAALCRAIPAGGVVVPALLHAAAWVLMIAAMMLPTTFPLLAIFRRITGARADGNRLVTLVALGFLLAWCGFGVIAHAADTGLRWAAARDVWFVGHGWMIGAGVLAAAGIFQWSALKYRCLDQCRSPFTFVCTRWHGTRPAYDAFRIGLDHGLFCVGCCWALMLVMFVVGTGNLGWMLALAVVMAAEKNLPWGRRLRTPLGLALLGWAAAVALANA